MTGISEAEGQMCMQSEKQQDQLLLRGEARDMNKKLWARESLFSISVFTKNMNSAIYTYILHLCGENLVGMPVLCLEHSVSALISNHVTAMPNLEKLLCPKGICHSPYCSAGYFKYIFKMFQSFLLVLAILQKQPSPGLNSRGEVFH